MNYCGDASKLLGIKIICGNNCPIYKNCPRLILEDATDKAISKAIKRMFEILERGKNESS